jgi:hypothetical protein
METETLGTMGTILQLQFPSYQLFHANETIDLQLTWLQPAPTPHASLLTMQTFGFGSSCNDKHHKINVSRSLYLTVSHLTALQTNELNAKLAFRFLIFI